MILKKNMRLGNKINLILILYFISFNFSLSEEKITTSPLINIEQIKPSFELVDDESENILLNQDLKEKKNINKAIITAGIANSE